MAEVDPAVARRSFADTLAPARAYTTNASPMAEQLLDKARTTTANAAYRNNAALANQRAQAAWEAQQAAAQQQQAAAAQQQQVAAAQQAAARRVVARQPMGFGSAVGRGTR